MSPFLCPPPFSGASPVSNCATFPSPSSSDEQNEEFYSSDSPFPADDSTSRPAQQWKVELHRTKENAVPVLRFSKKFVNKQVAEQCEKKRVRERETKENSLPALRFSKKLLIQHNADQQSYQDGGERHTTENALPVVRFSRKLVNQHVSNQQTNKVPVELGESVSRNISDDEVQFQCAVRHTPLHRPSKEDSRFSPPLKRLKPEPAVQLKEQSTFPKQQRTGPSTGFRAIWESLMEKKKTQNLRIASPAKQSKNGGRSANATVPPISGKLSKPANRPFRCTEAGCNKGIPHGHAQVERIRAFKCTVPKCTAKYYRKGDLKNHMLNKHGVPLDIRCPEPDCNKSFSSPALVAQHVRCEHQGIQTRAINVDAPRPPELHPCLEPGCNKNFLNRSKLESHVRCLHKGIRPFSCSAAGCEVSFARNSDCLRHMRNVHKLVTHFQCEVPGCGIKVARGPGYEKHMQNIHGGR